MSDIHALSGAYAVNALDDVERAAFERHLADCEVCAAEVAGLSEAAAAMTHAVEVSPPPALRDRLMAQVATTRVLPPVVQPIRPGRRRSFLVAAAAAVVLAIGGGVVATQPWDDKPGVITASQQVLDSPDARRVSAPVQGGGQVTIVRSDRLHEAVLLADGMPPAPSGRIYQIWYQNSLGRMVSAGLMPRGKSSLLLAGDPRTAQAVGITVEPEGGSETPTTTPVALVELA